ncbi:MAG: hypothetical protein HUU01_16430 [Saprospiraceae bacterium]|nr:hypothetical protein [Saprospiraceae bacterium]
MKINVLITTSLVILTTLMSSFRLQAQDATNGKPQPPVKVMATISDDFVIQLPDDQEMLSGEYLLDIKHISFKSKESLDRFCSAFSVDYQQLKGDFNRNEITLKFNLASISKRNLTVKHVGVHLQDLAGRMKYYFQNYNN